MSAPDRIWACEGADLDSLDSWQCDDGAEYIRADIVEAAVRRMQEWAAKKADKYTTVSDVKYGFGGAAGEIRAATPDQIAAIVRGKL
jgi:hypothetical protein